VVDWHCAKHTLENLQMFYFIAGEFCRKGGYFGIAAGSGQGLIKYFSKPFHLHCDL
jgi:hypothetical protein